jgi:glycosyltransferase involved in cell wall biosynthesis
MRIVELINTLEIGGAERMLVDLSRGLRTNGHQVSVVCLRESGPLSELLQQSSIPVLALRKRGGFRPGVVRALAHYLREARIDVIHTHNPLVHHYGLMAARLAGVPVTVNTLHGPSNLKGIGHTEIIFELSCLFSSCVVACCQAVHTHLRHVTQIAYRRSTVVRNGISVERFRSIPVSNPNGEVVFGTVGRLVAVKDHDSLLRAFAKVRERFPHCRLEILGDGPMRETLERTAAEVGIADVVCFHGSSLDVASFLSRIHVFVLCSLSEGLPLTVLEAMAAARPVVATSVGAIPELVETSNCGWIASPEHPNELAQAMCEALNNSNKLAEHGERGRRHVLEQYSVESMVSGYERLFEQLVAESRRKLPCPVQ